MRIHAKAGEGELHHVGATDDDEPLPPQPSHHGCIGQGGWRIGQGDRAGRGGPPCLIEQVLHRDGDAGPGTGRPAGGAQRIHGAGFGAGRFGMERGEGALALPGRILGTGKRGIDQGEGGGAAGGERGRGIGDVFHGRDGGRALRSREEGNRCA